MLAVFPWVAKYRIFSEERLIHAQLDAEEMEAMHERENDVYGGTKELAHEVVDVGKGIGVGVKDVGYEVVGVGQDIVGEVGRAGKVMKRAFSTKTK